jgi:hypothetical protein
MGSSGIIRVLHLARLANTCFFGVLSVVFIVLWIRSYWYMEGGFFSSFPGQHIAFHGGSGRMCVWFEHRSAPQWFSWHVDPNTEYVAPNHPDRMPWFDLAFFWPTMTRLYVAHWFLAVTTATIATAPWYPHKFSMRGLIVSLTILSVLMALITWIDRTF